MKNQKQRPLHYRIFSFLLCALMVLGLVPNNVPITAYAADAYVKTMPPAIYLKNVDYNGTKSTYVSPSKTLGTVSLHDIIMTDRNAYETTGFCFNYGYGLQGGGGKNTWTLTTSTGTFAKENADFAAMIDTATPFLNIYYYATQTPEGKADLKWNDEKALAFDALAQSVVWLTKAGELTDLSKNDQLDLLAREMQAAIKSLTDKGYVVTNGGAPYTFEQCRGSINFILEQI